MDTVQKLGYDLDNLLEIFGLQTSNECLLLDNWLTPKFEITEFEKQILGNLHHEMIEIGDYMNEEELKIRFVGALFLISKIDEPSKIRVFYERALSAIIMNYELSVICDCLIATPKGRNTPRNPYFFLQEFKKGKGEKNDPEAQMLMSMLIAQDKNQDDKPIYGGFLVGRNWIFTTLHRKNYCISRQYDASKLEDIQQIFFALKQLKNLILNSIEA